MKYIVRIAFTLALACAAGVAAADSTAKKIESPLIFGDVEYFHRWSKDDQHEFTPRDQEDLNRWSDMVTINRYRGATDGEGLAATANAVLENYKKNRATVLRTDSVSRTNDKPAEYLVVVLFPTPDFIEGVFARFKIVGGVGSSTVYSHREYGKKSGEQMSAWLKANGSTIEKVLMGWSGIPPLDDAPPALLSAGATASLPPSATAPSAELSPMPAILAAAERPEGVTGVFRMEVRGAGRKDGWLYLNSEPDFRDQRCLTIALSPEAAGDLEKLLKADPVTALNGRTIRVSGTAQRTTVWFFSNGVKTDKYYYQTQVRLTDVSPLRVLP